MSSNHFFKSLSMGALLFFAIAIIGESFAFAGKSGGRSFGKSSSWSSSTKGTWNRSGGGIFGGKGSSSGYSKPTSAPAQSSSPHSKPSLKEPSSGSTYSKPTFQPQKEAPSKGTGYSKPSIKESGADSNLTTGSAGKTSSGYTKPSAAPTASPGFSGGSKFDKKVMQDQRKRASQESLKAHQAEQSKFKQAPYNPDASKNESNPLYQKGKVYSGFDYKTHYGNRDGYYRSQGYQPPPYAYRAAPSFGIFDTLFLFWMLDHLGNRNVAAMAHNHSDDPGFKKWRQEADNLAKDNVELKSKLNELDNQMKAMAGTPKDPGYLPNDIPAEVALAAGALAAKKPEKPTLRMATGQEGGWYYRFGNIFKESATGVDVKLIPSSGSMANLKMLVDQQADLGIVQSDALALMDKKLPGKSMITEQTSLFLEFAQLIANRKGGVKSIRDLDPKKHTVFIGPAGSGTALTWEALCEQRENYRRIPTVNADYTSALEEVEKNPKSLMFFVGGLNSDFLNKAEEVAKKSGNLLLVAVDDKDLAKKKDSNGNAVYSMVNIPSNIYPYLEKGWIFSHDTKTLAVQAVLVLRTEWASQFGPTAMDALTASINEARPEIERLVNGGK